MILNLFTSEFFFKFFIFISHFYFIHFIFYDYCLSRFMILIIIFMMFKTKNEKFLYSIMLNNIIVAIIIISYKIIWKYSSWSLSQYYTIIVDPYMYCTIKININFNSVRLRRRYFRGKGFKWFIFSIYCTFFV